MARQFPLVISSQKESKEDAVQRRGATYDRMIREVLLEELTFEIRQEVSSAKSREGCSRQTEQSVSWP